jgi:hypothetical protein
MTSQMPALPTVLERLDRLEQHNEKLARQNRRLKFAGIVLLLLAGAVFLVSSPGPSRAEPKKAATLEAEKFILRDAAGKERATLMTGKFGPGLLLYDEQGKPSIALAAVKTGPLLYLLQGGRSRVALGLHKDGPGLYLADETEKDRVGLTVNKKGAALRLLDEKQKTRVALGAYPGGEDLSFSNERGRKRLSLAVADSTSGLSFFNDKDIKCAGLGLNKSGSFLALTRDKESSSVALVAFPTSTGIIVDDSARKNRAEMCLCEDKTVLKLFDKDENTLFSKP